MYEYTIVNKVNGEDNWMFGHSPADAFKRSGLDPDDWEILNYWYAD